MSSSHVSLWVPILVALMGFAGVLAAQVIANRREDKRWKHEQEQENQRWAREKENRVEARSDRRRQELADAIADYASSVTSLRRAEFNRGKDRIGRMPETEREPARQDTYRLRAEAESKMYLVSLLSDQEKDRDLVSGAVAVIEMCHQISARSVSEGELYERDRLAKESLDRLIEEASRRLRSQ
jgi:hypothetical protein